jgi:hypothetical protein
LGIFEHLDREAVSAKERRFLRRTDARQDRRNDEKESEIPSRFRSVAFDEGRRFGGLALNLACLTTPCGPFASALGGVDKFEPVSGGGEIGHSEEAVGQLIVSGGDSAVDLELSEHAFDAIALLVERPIMLDLHAAV